jgi:hypothetical protein
MISSGELKLPPRIDYLYVEQEVLADETPAVDAVLKADKSVSHQISRPFSSPYEYDCSLASLTHI